MTLAKAQSSPRNENRINSKLEIRNSKQFQMIKKRKVQNQFVSDFDIRISDFFTGFLAR